MADDPYPFHTKLAELQKVSQVLADCFTSARVNAQALWREKDAMQAAEDTPAIQHRETLLAKPEFSELAKLEKLRADAPTLAALYEVGPDMFRIREQRDLLAATLDLASFAKPVPSGGG